MPNGLSAAMLRIRSAAISDSFFRDCLEKGVTEHPVAFRGPVEVAYAFFKAAPVH